MSLLQSYDPPARLADFDAIPGQREAWHRFVLESFDANIAAVQQDLDKLAPRTPARPQFYSNVRYDPGGPIVEQAVVWNAFPKELLRRFGRARALVEADRLWPLAAYRLDWRYDPEVPSAGGLDPIDTPPDIVYHPTVEYCEWHVDREPSSGRIRRVTFTSEPPEYWQAMFGGKLDGSAIEFPGDKHLVLDLYRKLVSPQVELSDLVAAKPLESPFGTIKAGDYNPHNKWNTTHGIVHLSAPPNALTAEINLAALATKIYEDARGNLVVDPDAFIAGTGMGGANRNSDPTIAATVNVLARLGAMITLVNPVGLYMDHIDLSGWQAPGGVPATDCVRVIRGSDRLIERLVVEYPTDEFDVSSIRIGGAPLVYGGQIAECITVKLVGSAAAIGSAGNPRFKLSQAAFVDPADAREIYTSGRRGAPFGVVRAFEYESGEVVSPASRSARGTSPAAGRRMP